MTARIHVLFFDEKGSGPNECALRVERREPEEGDQLHFALQVEMEDVLGQLHSVGCFTLSPEQAADIHRQLGDALGADLGTALGDALAELAAERQVSDQRAGNIAMLEAEVERLHAIAVNVASELNDADAAVAAALGVVETVPAD